MNVLAPAPPVVLLERDAELQALQQRIAALARPGHGGCVRVVGEAGVGKTSLLQALRRSMPQPCRWLWGACEPLLSPPPLGPLIDMQGALPPPLAAAVARGGPPAQVMAGMLALVTDTRTPLVLVFEDVPWADGATLDLLRFLSRRLERTQALLVMTLRDEPLPSGHGLHRVLAGLPPRATLELMLAPLSPAAVERWAREGGRDPQGLHQATGGNPFFVAELLAGVPGRLPASVGDAVQARLAVLPPATRTLLQQLSISPCALEPQVLQALQPDAGSALQPARDAALLRCDADGVAFRHELARLAVESALPAGRAQALHAALLAVLDERTVSAARRVHHALAAGLGERVRQLAPLAAREAAEARAHHEAAALYELALAHAAPDPHSRAGLNEAHAQECMLVNRIDDAIAARRRALDIRRALGDELGQAVNLGQLAQLEWLLRGPQHGLPHAEAALPLLERAGDARELAMGHATLAQLHLLGPSAGPALHWARRALQRADGLDDPVPRVHALNTLGCAELRTLDSAAAWEPLQRSLALALQHDLPEHAARAYANLSSMALVQRRLADVLRWCEEGLAYCDARDLNMFTARLQLRRASAWFELGDWAATERELELLRALPAGTNLEREQTLQLQMRLRLRQGRLDDDVRAYWQATLRGERRLGVDPWYAPQAVSAAEAAWLLDDRAALRRIASEAIPAARLAAERWRIGQLACWLRRAGAPPLQEPVAVAPPCAAELAGDAQAAGEAWARHGCRFEQALALLGGDAVAVREALELLDTLGAPVAARKARQRLRALGVSARPRGQMPRTQADPLGLTPRERQIFELLCQGLPNRAIAERLHRSERTVEFHVSALLGKLGVSSRAAAIALVPRR